MRHLKRQLILAQIFFTAPLFRWGPRGFAVLFFIRYHQTRIARNSRRRRWRQQQQREQCVKSLLSSVMCSGRRNRVQEPKSLALLVCFGRERRLGGDRIRPIGCRRRCRHRYKLRRQATRCSAHGGGCALPPAPTSSAPNAPIVAAYRSGVSPGCNSIFYIICFFILFKVAASII